MLLAVHVIQRSFQDGWNHTPNQSVTNQRNLPANPIFKITDTMAKSFTSTCFDQISILSSLSVPFFRKKCRLYRASIGIDYLPSILFCINFQQLLLLQHTWEVHCTVKWWRCCFHSKINCTFFRWFWSNFTASWSIMCSEFFPDRTVRMYKNKAVRRCYLILKGAA